MAGILDSATHYSDFYEENNFTLDNIEEMTDFTHKDVPYIQEYQSLKGKSTALTTAEQSRLIELVKILKGKLISIETFNKTNQSVAYMQKYFKNNTVDLLANHKAAVDSKVAEANSAITEKVSEATTDIENKVTDAKNTITEKVTATTTSIDNKLADTSTKIDSTVSEGISDINTLISRLTIKYAYSEAQKYYPCNIITYNNGTSTDVYICNRECKGIAPDVIMTDGSTNPWTKLSLKGEQGEPGANFSYQKDWDAYKKYSETNLVWFNNTLYFSLQNENIGHAPNEADSQYWKAWVYAMPDGSVSAEKLSENVLALITSATVMTDKTTSLKYRFEIDNGNLYVVEL